MLAGRDGSRALAKMSLDAGDVREEYDDLTDLSPFQIDALNDWVMKFQTRYTEVSTWYTRVLHVVYTLFIGEI